MKIVNILLISLFLFIVFSCKQNKQDEINSVFAGEHSKKWYAYSIDENHSLYPYRVKEFFKDGRQIQYINNYTTKNLDTIPKDNMYNPEKWFIINDSVVAISSVRNPKSGYYHKNTSKILYYSKDTIILQGTKRSNYEGVHILTRYREEPTNE